MTAMRLKRYPSPSGGFALGKMGVGATMLRHILPAGARWVDYLQCTGTQYIDTGVVPDATTEFIVTAAPTVSTEQFMGAISASANRFHFSFYSGGYIRGCIGVNQTNMGSADTSFHSMSLNAGGKVVTMDGVSYACNWKGQIPAVSLWLFGRNSNKADYVRKIKCKISSCKIYQSNTLVRDFIPVRKGNVGYLYDRVSGALFGNAGTGDFVIGPDINSPAI